MTQSGKNRDAEAGLEPLLQAHIGRKLREYYDSAAREPVPDRFKMLLDRLEAGEQPVPATEGAGKAGRA